MRTRDRQSGFTLVEIMVVVVIVSILSALLISVSGSTYGSNPQRTSEEVATLFNNCKMRAVSTRRWHRCEVTPTGFTMFQWSATGLTTPSGACSPPATNCWQLISTLPFGSNVLGWANSTVVEATATGTVQAQNATMVADIDFKPDGSSSAGTIYFTDRQGNKPWRTVVYRYTGSSYARSGW